MIVKNTWVSANGWVGRVAEVSPKRRNSLVQFGADGPFKRFATSKLRQLTDEEVRNAGYGGVG